MSTKLSKETDLDWLTSVPMAHRGLHDPEQGIIENSASAFGAAVEAGYGIECDIQVSADGEAMVFHDAKLDRLTESPGRLASRNASEIGTLRLGGSSDTIQTLGELLEQVGGRVPLLIEIKKTEQRPGALEERTRDLLASYSGPAAVMSFSPHSMGWFAANAPQIPRGQLSTTFKKGAASNRPWIQRFLARHLLVNRISRPNFIGYDINYLPTLATSFLRYRGMPILTWTVRTNINRDVAAKFADNIIFEGFRPSLEWAVTHE